MVKAIRIPAELAERVARVLRESQSDKENVTQNPPQQARLVRKLLSNCTFDRGSLCPTYVKPFDPIAKGAERADWLPRLDDFRNWLIREAA
jgi:hypothetical protein